MTGADELDTAALALSVRELALQIARSYLAVRRDDRHAAEAHLITAQRIVATIDRGLPRVRE